jgi:hypothetical protein
MLLGVVPALEPIGSEVLVVAFVGEHVPDGNEHGVGDDEDGFGLALLAEAPSEALVLRGVVAVARVRR